MWRDTHRHPAPQVCSWDPPALPLGIFGLLKDEYIHMWVESAAAALTDYPTVSWLPFCQRSLPRRSDCGWSDSWAPGKELLGETAKPRETS